MIKIKKNPHIDEYGINSSIKNNTRYIKIVIATNHVSFVKDFIYKHFDKTYIDDIFISAEIHKVKPNADFYKAILDKYNIKPNELLFVDDSQTNIDGAKALKINTIKIEKDSNVSYEIINYLKNK